MNRAPIGPPDPLLAGVPAVGAGDFVFLSGHIAPDPGQDPMRFRSEDQTAAIFETIEATLEEAGSSLAQVAKLQTFHRDLDDFPAHLAARTRAFTPPLPPSTAVEGSLSHPDAEVLVNAIAVTGESRPEAVEVEGVPQPLGPYSQAVSAPPFVFLAGVLASDFLTGVAPEARVDPALPYFGSPIKAQTSFVLDTISRLLEGAGSSLGSVVKAQVILTDISDFWGFEEVWRSYFPTDPPVRTVVEGGLVNPGCIVEVDVIALAADSGLSRETVGLPGTADSPLAESPAIRAGDWLFFGARMATDYKTGVAPEARIDPNFPRYETAVRRQGRYLLDDLAGLLEAGGSSLDRLVKLWTFVDGRPADFLAMRRLLGERLGESPPAVTLTGTGGLVVPECRVVADGIALVR
ncbi:MAG TPA: RidA family protein [Acidimicrobiia bacterium]|nr:RidA family protein [Acidimicrobiia bacterium]